MSTGVSRAALIATARVEAGLLIRNVLVIAGLIAGGLVACDLAVLNHAQLLWWSSGWEIGFGQLVLSTTAVIAAQLATTRARRDGLAELYASFPVGERTRAMAHQLSVLGTAVPGLVIVAVMVGLFEAHGILGSFQLWVLAAGVLLVVAGAAIGVAIGRWIAHPMAGIIGALAWFVLTSQTNRFNGGVVWLLPWANAQFNTLPGPLAGYPPAAMHCLELAGIAVLAGAVTAIARSATAGRALGAWRRQLVVGTTALVAIAAIVGAGVGQFRPIPTAALSRAVNEVAQPQAQRCERVAVGQAAAQYCAFPAYWSLVAELEPVVGGVLAQLPAGRAQPLLIAQTSGLDITDPTLNHGQSRTDIAQWSNELAAAPANRPSTSAVYLDLTSWPTPGHQGTARFALAIRAALWAVGLQTSSGIGAPAQQCVPVDQAREAVAIWFAERATHTYPVPRQPVALTVVSGYVYVVVADTAIIGWTYPGQYSSYLPSSGPTLTAAGFLLASAMDRLPVAQVLRVITTQWRTWTNSRSSDAQLAAALGIGMPSVPTAASTLRGVRIAAPNGVIPDQPVCP